MVPVFPWRQGSHFLSHITRLDLSTKPDFRPLSPKSLVRLGSLILGSGMAPGRTIKKRHKSRGKEVNTGGRCEGGELKYGYHHTSGANQSSLKEKECILIKVYVQPLAFTVQMPTCVMLLKDLRAVAFRALCR